MIKTATNKSSKLHDGLLPSGTSTSKIKSEDKMAKALVYSRVSTTEQVENKQSLDMQEVACRDFAAKRDIEIARVFREEGESAKTADRTKLQEMLKFCHENKNDIKYVIVWKVDRFSRNTADYMMMRALLLKLGVQILSATEPIENTVTGKLTETILAGFAEFDNDVRSERSRNGMLGRAKEGGWVHQAPIGYRNIKDTIGRPTLEPDDMASQVTALLLEFKKGIYTPIQAVQLAAQLNIRTKYNKPISANGVYKMLRNPVYAGKIASSMFAEIVDGLHKGLISYDDHLLILNILSGRKKTIKPEARSKEPWPLRRFIRCSECGHPLTGSRSKGYSKHYEYYHCTHCNKGTRVRRDKTHHGFVNKLGSESLTPDVLNLFKEIVVRRWNKEHRDVQQERRKIDEQLRQFEDTRNAIVDKNLSGVYNDTLTAEQLNRIAFQKSELELKRSVMHVGELENEEIVDLAVKFIANSATLWQQATLENRQRFQKMVFPEGISVDNEVNFGTARKGLCFEECDLIKELVLGMNMTTNVQNSTVVTQVTSDWSHILEKLTQWYEILKGVYPLKGLPVLS